MAKRGRPRKTGSNKSEAYYETKRKRELLRYYIKKAGPEIYEDMKPLLTKQFFEEETALREKLGIIDKTGPRTINEFYQTRLTELQDRHKRGREIGIKNAINLFYKIQANQDVIEVEGKEYLYYEDNSEREFTHFALRNGTIVPLMEVNGEFELHNMVRELEYERVNKR